MRVERKKCCRISLLNDTDPHSNKIRIKERFRVKYENADNIFPEKLLLEIRRFMPEGYVYISPQSSRKEWGSVSGQKKELEKRNSEIYKEYLAGKSVDAISKERYLSKSSIYRILKQFEHM